MGNSKVKRIVLGAVSTNCYILYHDDTKHAVVFDPADDAGRIADIVHELGLCVDAIMLTHGHFDHILAAGELRQLWNCKVMAHEDEEDVAADVQLNLSVQFGAGYTLKIDETLTDKQEINIAGFDMQVLHTPGHTKGSTCYYLQKEGIIFSGDTLFAGSVGRSDFPTGSGAVLLRSVREKLMPLPDETQVLPGHGDTSTIGYEKENNPFI